MTLDLYKIIHYLFHNIFITKRKNEKEARKIKSFMQVNT